MSKQKRLPSGGVQRLSQALKDIFASALEDNAQAIKKSVRLINTIVLRDKFNKIIPVNIKYYKAGFIGIVTAGSVGSIVLMPDQGISLIATAATLAFRKRPTNSHMKSASATITTLHGAQYLLNGNIGGVAMAASSVVRSIGLTIIPDNHRKTRTLTAITAGTAGALLASTTVDPSNPLTYLPFLSITAGSISDLLRDEFSHTARAFRLAMCSSNMTYDTAVSHIVGGVLTSAFSAKVLIQNAISEGDFKNKHSVLDYLQSLKTKKHMKYSTVDQRKQLDLG